MNDNSDITDYSDRKYIDENQNWERDYWSDKWGISDKQLSEAIEQTGSTEIAKIERYLIDHQKLQG